MSDLNSVQAAALDAITAARNAIQGTFSEQGDHQDLVDNTLMRLCAYLSDRSQAVSYLVSSGFAWDGEIILRSFYEVNAKIWLICLSAEDQRPALTEEFWGTLASIHNHKRAHRAAAAQELFRRQGKPDDEAVFSVLMQEDLFDRGQGNKQARKAIDQKWSFTEIIRFLAANPPEGFNLIDITGVLHMYGQASHLIHADDAALDLMLDRQLRSPEELKILASAHVCRIWSDLVSLWCFSSLTIGFRFDPKARIGAELRGQFSRFHELSRPFLDAFHKSQADFYARVRDRQTPPAPP
jgi:hypothetical protein